MKTIMFIIAVTFTFKSFGQSTEEQKLLNLSNKVFEWEVKDKIDSLENIFHDQFIVVSSDGSCMGKSEYIKRLRSGDFIHNSIEVEEARAIVTGNTGTIVGKGKFLVTVSGNKLELHLSFMEVLTRSELGKPWKIVGMKASILEK